MAERIRTIEYGRRLGTVLPQRPAPGEQIADERFSGGNQLIGEDIPRARLDASTAQQGLELSRAFGAYGEVVVDDDRLSIEEETLIGRRRMVEQLVDELDEALAESLVRLVPLAVPMGVSNDVNVQGRRMGEAGSETAVAKLATAVSQTQDEDFRRRYLRIR